MDALVKRNQELEAELGTLRAALAESEARGEYLALKLAELRRKIFGRSSEKLRPRDDGLVQLDFGQTEQAIVEEEEEVEEVITRRKKRRGNRKPIPEHFHRERIEIEVDPELRSCPDCKRDMRCIGEDITEELEYVPALLYVLEYARKKYACRKCQSGVITAPLPPRPIKKGRPGPGLLAYVLASKFEDHLPLHRLERIFARHGMEISRKTLCDWVGAMHELLRPIVESMRRDLLSKRVIQADETFLRVQDRERGAGTTRQGYLWTYGDSKGEVVYDFRMDRTSASPNEMLAGFKGFLQTDAYAGYNAICRTGDVERLGCWAHVRRKFFEARKEKPQIAGPILGAIAKLYRIERQAKEEKLEGDAVVDLRRREARPILETLREVLEAEQPNRLPESGLGDAISHALKQWPDLVRYVEVADAEIDNNGAERSLRGVVIGRKNWLFIGHPSAGPRAATILSLVESCRRLGVNTLEYFRDVIRRMAEDAESAPDLTPRSWQAARASSTENTSVPAASDGNDN